VDVGEQEAVDRRTHINRRTHIDRDRDEHRLRQVEDAAILHKRRRERDKVVRRWRQEKHRRRRRWREIVGRIAEHQDRLVEIGKFVLRRRRNVVSKLVERGRRLGRSRHDRKPATRIGRVRTTWIATQI
jgi:hypothetical protein